MTALGIANLIIAGGLVIFTAYYAKQTRDTVAELRAGRQLNVAPYLLLDVVMAGPTYGLIAVTNVGTGAAIDADLTLTLEAKDGGDPDERHWRAHTILPLDRHEFLPPDGVDSMEALATLYPRATLNGTMRDALGQTHTVSERIEVGTAWELLRDAKHRWAEPSAEKLVREVGRAAEALKKIEGHLRAQPRRPEILSDPLAEPDRDA